MKTWIALLKGINVGGNNKIRMQDLVQQCAALGYANIRTYIQSGNLVFSSSAGTASQHAANIAAMIASQFNITTSVIVLTQAELNAALQSNPFPELQHDEQAKRLHLYFLAAPSTQLDLQRLNQIKKDDERWQYQGEVFYLHTPQGAGDSKLAMQVEKIVGVPCTARNLRTVLALQEMLRKPLL